MNPVIVTKNLTEKYKETGTEALKGINLIVNEGEFLGLLGPNSAGKTTLTSIICGLLSPTSGEVLVFNEDIIKSPAEIKKRIGLVPQEIGSIVACQGAVRGAYKHWRCRSCRVHYHCP